MMLHVKVILLILVYFTIGAVLIAIINKQKKDPVANRERWIKYAMYLLIVGIIVFSMIYLLEFFGLAFKLIGIVILIMAFNELLGIWSEYEAHKTRPLVIGLLTLTLFSIGFFMYSCMWNSPFQLLVYVFVFTFDGFSQLAGQLFGKHKFASKISPNKTLEGLIGGFLLTCVTGLFLLNHYPFSFVLVTCTIICVAALLGDLLASYFKRLHHAKDFGRSLPGHGGFLDRFDSFIAAGAIYWFISELTAYF